MRRATTIPSIAAAAIALLSIAITPTVDAQYRRLGRPDFIDPDPKTVQTKEMKSRRRFVSYRSSEWEQMWLENIDQWTREQKICHVLLSEQAQIVHDYLNLLCTSRMPAPYDHWCVIDDELHPLWYNGGNRERFDLTFERPSEVPDDVPVPPPWPVRPGPQHDHIVSRFIFLDEITGEYTIEYIEPLISHLRFPLAMCLEAQPNDADHKYHFVTFRGWVLPPPPVVKASRAILYDAGSSTWVDGAGGPSLAFLTKMWLRHGIDFDVIYAFDWEYSHEEFYTSVPDEYKAKVHFRKAEISSSLAKHNDAHPFLPQLIKEATDVDDYVVFKLDIDAPTVEDGSMVALLDPSSTKVDEVIWEHHVSGNYLMSPLWLDAVSDLTIRQSYEYFLRLREKGIRAHSWV